MVSPLNLKLSYFNLKVAAMKRSASSDHLKHSVNKAFKMNSNSWPNSLYNAVNDKNLLLFKDTTIYIIKDGYPKARHHMLVIPRENIADIYSLNKSHIDLIKYMELNAKQMAKSIDSKCEFRYGFHVIPSLKPLHLHVISQDFVSDFLKTKKHYNSFTTPFFIDSKSVIEMLEKSGKVETMSKLDAEKLLKQDMKCHCCRLPIKTMPYLKQHLLTHYPKI